MQSGDENFRKRVLDLSKQREKFNNNVGKGSHSKNGKKSSSSNTKGGKSKSGKDKKKTALIPFLCDLAKATDMSDAVTSHGSNGMKWHKASKKIFAFMKVKGKGGLIWFFRKSLASASDERIQAQWAEDKVRLIMGEHLSNYVSVANDISNGATRRTKLPRRCWLRHG